MSFETYSIAKNEFKNVLVRMKDYRRSFASQSQLKFDAICNLVLQKGEFELAEQLLELIRCEISEDYIYFSIIHCINKNLSGKHSR